MTKRCPIKRHLIDICFAEKNLKKISFCHLLGIFSLCRRDDLKKITFSRLLVFCAVWERRSYSIFVANLSSDDAT